MQTWQIETDLGLHDLARHRPRAALGHLARALEQCPGKRSGDLVRVLFYLGVTMRKLGLPNPALRSWIACRKLSKRGYGSKMAGRYTNVYGMERQDNSDEDDWQAFRSVQVRRYLGEREGGRFSSGAEADLVMNLIWDHWTGVRKAHDLGHMTPAQKCALFRGESVPFPRTVARAPENIIPVSFWAGRRVSYDDRCPCGSGRPYRECCGRTAGADEIVCGLF